MDVNAQNPESRACATPCYINKFPHFILKKPENSQRKPVALFTSHSRRPTVPARHAEGCQVWRSWNPYWWPGSTRRVRSWTSCFVFPGSRLPVPESLGISTLNGSCWLFWCNLFFLSPALKRDPRSLVADVGQTALFLSSSTRPFEPMRRERREWANLNN